MCLAGGHHALNSLAISSVIIMRTCFPVTRQYLSPVAQSSSCALHSVSLTGCTMMTGPLTSQRVQRWPCLLPACLPALQDFYQYQLHRDDFSPAATLEVLWSACCFQLLPQHAWLQAMLGMVGGGGWG